MFPKSPPATTSPDEFVISKETSLVNEPVVQVAVNTAPSGAEKVSEPDDPSVIVAFSRTGTPSARIVIALPFQPSPQESNMLSVKSTIAVSVLVHENPIKRSE